MTDIKDLAELGSVAAIQAFIRENAVSVTHEGKTIKIFNATQQTLNFGTPDEELAVIAPSGYSVVAVPENINDTYSVEGLTWVYTRWHPSADIVWLALGGRFMYEVMVVTSFVAAQAYPQGRAKVVVPCKGFEQAKAKRMQWDRFGVAQYTMNC